MSSRMYDFPFSRSDVTHMCTVLLIHASLSLYIVSRVRNISRMELLFSRARVGKFRIIGVRSNGSSSVVVLCYNNNNNMIVQSYDFYIILHECARYLNYLLSRP